jgi:hypothetical protein
MFWDTTINDGDTVVVVRDCCGMYLGRVFKVSFQKFIQHPSWIDCDICKKSYSNIPYVGVGGGREGDFVHCPMHWLKKLPPISETDDVRQDEEITA